MEIARIHWGQSTWPKKVKNSSPPKTQTTDTMQGAMWDREINRSGLFDMQYSS